MLVIWIHEDPWNCSSVITWDYSSASIPTFDKSYPVSFLFWQSSGSRRILRALIYPLRDSGEAKSQRICPKGLASDVRRADSQFPLLLSVQSTSSEAQSKHGCPNLRNVSVNSVYEWDYDIRLLPKPPCRLLSNCAVILCHQRRKLEKYEQSAALVEFFITGQRISVDRSWVPRGPSVDPRSWHLSWVVPSLFALLIPKRLIWMIFQGGTDSMAGTALWQSGSHRDYGQRSMEVHHLPEGPCAIHLTFMPYLLIGVWVITWLFPSFQWTLLQQISLDANCNWLYWALRQRDIGRPNGPHGAHIARLIECKGPKGDGRLHQFVTDLMTWRLWCIRQAIKQCHNKVFVSPMNITCSDS